MSKSGAPSIMAPCSRMLGAIGLLCLAFTSAHGQVSGTPQALSNGLTRVPNSKVTNITLKAPLEHTRGGGQRMITYSEGGGSISIQAVLADGGTGEVIAAVADSKYANDLWQRNTRVQNIADLSRAFSGWARALAKRMAGSA